MARVKPLVFNYKQYEDLREAYKALLEDNNQLMADNKRLRKDKTNLEIKCRILESRDVTNVVYLCDRKACGGECPNEECSYTQKVEHAVNFKEDMGSWWERKGDD